MSEMVTRLAPSPTGALHLGNARTFLINWLAARKAGWKIIMRIEDLDGPRVKKGAAAQAIEDLRWLGLDWDSQSPDQSTRSEAYEDALEKLATRGLAYRCNCSRRDIELAAAAPHREDGLTRYPGTCRNRTDKIPKNSPAAWRIVTDDAVIEFEDVFAGPQRFDMADIGGDFVIFKTDGTAAYQLAVVIDDAQTGITHIVRGDDLLDSAARQLHLMKLLDIDILPHYYHIPLIVGPDGRRLAKRHGDTRLSFYRENGTTPQRMLGLLGYWSGLLESPRETEMPELLANFDISALPHEETVFTDTDNAFLLGDK